MLLTTYEIMGMCMTLKHVKWGCLFSSEVTTYLWCAKWKHFWQFKVTLNIKIKKGKSSFQLFFQPRYPLLWDLKKGNSLNIFRQWKSVMSFSWYTYDEVKYINYVCSILCFPHYIISSEISKWFLCYCVLYFAINCQAFLVSVK